MQELPTERRLRMAERCVIDLGKAYAQARVTLIPVTTVSTGFPEIDGILDGGWPCGRLSEVYGPEGSGKTTVALSTAAQVQKSGGVVAWLDAENRLEPRRAETLGVAVTELLVYRPSSAEEAFDIAFALVASGNVDLLVLDSVAALVPRRELDGRAEDWDANATALINRAIRKLAVLAGRSNTCVLLLNQIREMVGVVFGRSETTPGGRAIRHHASARVEFRKVSAVKCGDLVTGQVLSATTTKNSLGRSHLRTEFKILQDGKLMLSSKFPDAASTSGEVVERERNARSEASEHLPMRQRRSELSKESFANTRAASIC